MKRPLVRFSLLFLLSLAILFALQAAGFLDVLRVRAALREHAGAVFLSSLCIAISALIAVIRHDWALRVLGARTPWTRVASANLIALALGQWTSSMAVAEVVRIGTLVRDRQPGERSTFLVRVAMASLVDRVLGTGVLFLVGSCAAFIAALKVAGAHQGALFLVCGVTFMLGIGLVVCPLAADTGIVRGVITWLRTNAGSRLPGRVFGRGAAFLEHLRDASSRWGERPSAIAVTSGLAAIVSILSGLSLYFAGVAMEAEVPFLILMAIYPTTIVATIVPLGFAGLGAPQLVSAALFAPFGVAVEALLALTLLQSTLVLIINTSVGLGWAVAQGGQVLPLLRSALRAEPAEK